MHAAYEIPQALLLTQHLQDIADAAKMAFSWIGESL
jgi:hypothetical protein